MKKSYPEQVCKQCGMGANTLTCLVKYGSLPKKVAFDVSTFYAGTCDYCGSFTTVTQSRDFFYPDFSLLNAKFKKSLSDKSNH